VKSESSLEGSGTKRQHTQPGGSAASKTFSPASTPTSRLTAQNLLALNNKYSMEHSSLSLSSPTSAGDSVSQSNVNQNNNQGNVRQGGDGTLQPPYYGPALHLNTSSSSEPIPAFHSLTSQLHLGQQQQQQRFLTDQLLLLHQQHLQRQLPGGVLGSMGGVGLNPQPITFPNLGLLPPDHLADMRARADSFHSSIFLNSPASKTSEISQERVVTPQRGRELLAISSSSAVSPHQHTETAMSHQHTETAMSHQHTEAVMSHQQPDHNDSEVSQINGGDNPLLQSQPPEEQQEEEAAHKKRHASAPNDARNSLNPGTTHSVLLTVYYSLCTTHSILLTLYYSFCTVHSVLFTLYCSLCTTHCILPTLYCSLCTAHSILLTVYYPLCSLYCSLCTALFNANCFLCSISQVGGVQLRAPLATITSACPLVISRSCYYPIAFCITQTWHS